MTPEDARLCALLRCADDTVDWTSANGLMGTAAKRLEELSDELALHDASIEPMHRMMLERDRLKAENERLSRELEEASPLTECARCKQKFRLHNMVPEEGNEWECMPCNERENARERAALEGK